MATKKKKTASSKPKEKLPPLKKFDWKKELRANEFKISRDGKISKQVLNQPRSGKQYTEKQLLRRQAMMNIPAYKQKKFTKTQALNQVVRQQGYKNIKQYFKIRKEDKHRIFERKASERGKEIGLGSDFEQAYANWQATGYERGSEAEFDLLYEIDDVADEDYDRYTED